MDGIKIKTLSVKKLFNQFSYNFDFKTENNISIVIGPNGTGKTTIMEFMSFVFAPTGNTLRRLFFVPFDSIEFVIESHEYDTIVVTYIKTPCADTHSVFPCNLIIKFNINGKCSEIDLSKLANERQPQLLDRSRDSGWYSEHAMGTARARVPRRTLNAISPEHISYEMFADLAEKEINTATETVFPDRDSFQFIKANRFEPMGVEREWVVNGEVRGKELTAEPLKQLIRDVSRYYRMCCDEYDARVSSALQFMPSMYLSGDVQVLPYDEFIEKFSAYKERLEKYIDIGFVREQSSTQERYAHVKFKDLEITSKLYESKKDFLNVYLRMFDKTLDALDEPYKKIKLFVDIFNKRNEITKKSLVCSPNGVEVQTPNGILQLDCLSSGEKNDLIMFYELIFGAGEIVFIDEPEISLHIEWQAEFVNTLKDICDQNNVQVIIATHSPYIVGGHTEFLADKVVDNA